MGVSRIISRLARLASRSQTALRLIACLSAVAVAGPSVAQAQTVAGDVQIDTSAGYARILVHLAEEVESDVRVAGGIVVVSFKRPVNAPIEKVQAALPGVIGAARRDPDGRGFRIALNRKLTVNSMAAGERLYIDLLPENWVGLAPGLPKDVIEDLSRRAREAERLLRSQRQAKTEKPARVRVATQPTFTRYVFELPDVVAVTSDRGADDVTLVFAARVKFDFGEVKTTLPPTVKAIEMFEQNDTVSVRFALTGKTDVRMFREDKNYVVDIGASKAKEALAPVVSPDGNAVPPNNAGANPVALAGVEAPPPAPAPAVAVQPSTQATSPQAVPEAKASATAPSPERTLPVREPSGSAEPKHDASGNGPPTGQDGVAAKAQRQGDGLQLTFAFPGPTGAAVFRRAGSLWLVFDTRGAIDLSGIPAKASALVRHVQGMALPDGYVIRLMLDRPRLVSAAADGGTWTVTIGDTIADPTSPLSASRDLSSTGHSTLTVPLSQPRELHRIADPDMGDNLLVVTALAPARGFLKEQDFVEFRALASTHGVALQPLADDVQVELSPDHIVVARPGGLILSGTGNAQHSAAAYRPMVLDTQLWERDRRSPLTERQYQLIAAAAEASEAQRNALRVDLARFYLAREMFAEAKGVLDVVLAEERPTADDPTGLVLRAIASLMLNRPEDALKELAHPLLGNLHDAPLWRALAHARLGKWDEARREFRSVNSTIAMLPVELQRLTMMESMRASIEVRDFASAQTSLSDFQVVGTSQDMSPAMAVMQGRLAQGLGKTSEALKNYRVAANSEDRRWAAQGQLRSLALRYETGDLKRPDLVSELETLTTLWRGDETEIEALHKLVRLYGEEQRFRDAFHVMRAALKAHPKAETTRRIQNEAVASFDSLFLAGKGDALPAIEALSLFYDFRELTPIGRRGDEMIRRLADRLVSVDLLQQAAELLQHQVDNRLQGAARAQVATRLAVIYLMHYKPDRAQAVLRATRAAELGTDLRQLRLLLEARALSGIGRHDVALEAIAGIDNREALRLRADILWAAKRFGPAAEQIELLHGERWRDFAPMSDVERADVLRAAIGYAIGGDVIGLSRLREKYEAKMMESPDKRAFTVATAPYQANGEEFRDLAKTVAAFDSLDAFLRDMRARYPEIGAISPVEAPPAQKQSSRAAPTPDASVR